MIHIAIQSFFESCTGLDLSASCGDIFRCPISHYVKENIIWSALNAWSLHFIECSFILVLWSKLEKNVRYFFSRVFGILSYCVPSYLPLFWNKQISFLSISSGDSLCLYLYTLWPPNLLILILILTLWPPFVSAGFSRAWGGAWTVYQRRIQCWLSSWMSW